MGYNVCDVLESAHCGIVKIWLDFMNGERPIEDVLEGYQNDGFGWYFHEMFYVNMTIFQMQIKTYQVIFIGNPYSMHAQDGDQKSLDSFDCETLTAKVASIWYQSLDKMRK